MTNYDVISRIAFIVVGVAGFTLSLYRLSAIWADKGLKRYWILVVCAVLYIPIATDNLITKVLPRSRSFALVLLLLGIWFATYYSIRKTIREKRWAIRDRSIFVTKYGNRK